MAYLVTLVFHVNVITCRKLNLQHFYCIFVKKPIFKNENLKNSHIVSKHGSNYVK
jgi:hypothetical protein